MTPFDELKQALDTAAACGRNVDVFFRDDDADDDLPNLHCLLDTFGERGAPINLEVIPGTLTSRGADLLQRRRKQGLIELNQHGWMHTNHEAAGRKYEFGPSRNYAQQFEDIERGRDVLNSIFAGDWRPVFTPPWNRCTRDTLRAVDELGFAALSRDASEAPVTDHRFCEISTTFDIYTWKNGAAMKPEAVVAASLAAQVRAGHAIGILLHHKVMTPEAFEIVGNLLDQFRQSSAVRLHTFESAMTKELSPCDA
jgi:peptidoglycan/xylan/chitin deacetylase (PgdA/CDA1 family)